MDLIKIGEFISELRTEKGLTQLFVVFHAIRNNMMMAYVENNVYGNVYKNKKC